MLALKGFRNDRMVARSVKPQSGVQRHAAASTQKAINSAMKQRVFSRSAGIERSENICFMYLINEKINSGKPRREGGERQYPLQEKLPRMLII